mmetsp:Transcript_25571/g.52003  ORF Transcript_25571/g.52003 Transcript_25571/m.52003 type:complete len:215 (+) Transcript_25571:967-1611(+)
MSRFTSSAGLPPPSEYRNREYSTRSASHTALYLCASTAAPSSISFVTRARSESSFFMRSFTRPISEKLAILTACSNWYLRVSRFSISWSLLSSLSLSTWKRWRYILAEASWCWMYMSRHRESSSVSRSCLRVMTASRMLAPRARASSTARILAERSFDSSACPVFSSCSELLTAALTRALSCWMARTSDSTAVRALMEAFSLLMHVMMRTISSR